MKEGRPCSKPSGAEPVGDGAGDLERARSVAVALEQECAELEAERDRLREQVDGQAWADLVAQLEQARGFAATVEAQNAAGLTLHETTETGWCLTCDVHGPCPTNEALGSDRERPRTHAVEDVVRALRGETP